MRMATSLPSPVLESRSSGDTAVYGYSELFGEGHSTEAHPPQSRYTTEWEIPSQDGEFDAEDGDAIELYRS